MANQNDSNTDISSVPAADAVVSSTKTADLVDKIDSNLAVDRSDVLHSAVHKFVADVEEQIKKFESVTSIFHVVSITKAIKALIADLKSKL